MQQRVTVSGFIYDNGKVLILKRGAQETFLANHWEVPGGKLEYGEDPIVGALREVKEEAGIDCEVLCIHHTWGAVNDYRGQKTHFVEICFIMKMKPNQKVVVGDGMADAKWISKNELSNYLMSPEMKKEIESGFKWVNNHAAFG